jgi:hypothetical protein
MRKRKLASLHYQKGSRMNTKILISISQGKGQRPVKPSNEAVAKVVSNLPDMPEISAADVDAYNKAVDADESLDTPAFTAIHQIWAADYSCLWLDIDAAKLSDLLLDDETYEGDIFAKEGESSDKHLLFQVVRHIYGAKAAKVIAEEGFNNVFWIR